MVVDQAIFIEQSVDEVLKTALIGGLLAIAGLDAPGGGLPDRMAQVNALLDAKNDKYHRKLVNGIDPLWRVSRKRTVFPGQHACCWYCGCCWYCDEPAAAA